MNPKKILLSALLLAAVALPAAAREAEPAPVFGLGMGLQYWHADDMDVCDKDAMGGANLIARYRPVPYLGIDCRLGCSGVWDGDKYRMDGKRYETDVVFLCVPVEFGLLGMLPAGDSFTFYAGPGVGYYWYDIDVKTTRKHHHHYHTEWNEHVKLADDIGWYAVAGADWRIVPCLSLFAEARYTGTGTHVRHEKSAEIDCSGFGGQIGILFNF
ncbi:MAG: outer membrane beta-barrel protein [Kiritimatiellae bacterium]|nr:outer membrane beta-barrel protein [Kiritimatiellia bacterium]